MSIPANSNNSETMLKKLDIYSNFNPFQYYLPYKQSSFFHLTQDGLY